MSIETAEPVGIGRPLWSRAKESGLVIRSAAARAKYRGIHRSLADLIYLAPSRIFICYFPSASLRATVRRALTIVTRRQMSAIKSRELMCDVQYPPSRFSDNSSGPLWSSRVRIRRPEIRSPRLLPPQDSSRPAVLFRPVNCSELPAIVLPFSREGGGRGEIDDTDPGVESGNRSREWNCATRAACERKREILDLERGGRSQPAREGENGRNQRKGRTDSRLDNASLSLDPFPRAVREGTIEGCRFAGSESCENVKHPFQ